MRREIFIRLIVEVRAKEQARRAWQRVARAWSDVARAERFRIEPHRKLLDGYELTAALVVHDDARAAEAHERIVAALGTKWLRAGSEAVWRPGPGARFVDGDVRWAHVEISDVGRVDAPRLDERGAGAPF